MSILSNILTEDSYGERYYLQYQNLLDNQVSVKIYERDYSGSSTAYVAAGNDVDISRSFTDGDFFKPIAGTQIHLKIVTNEPNEFRDFRHADNRKYWVEVTLAGTTVAFGYILPETFEQDWGSKPHIVRVTAADQLGLLHDMPFQNNDESQIVGIERVSDIITFLLNKAGMRGVNRWWDGVGIRPHLAENTSRGLFYNLYMDCGKWKDYSCYEVLVELLEAFNCQISQYQFRWIIKSPTETRIYYGVKYNRAGDVLTTGITTDSEFQVTGTGHDGLYASRLSMIVERPIGKVEVEYEKLLRETLVRARSVVGGGSYQVRFFQNSFSMWPTNLFDGSGVGLSFDVVDAAGSEGRFKFEMDVFIAPRINYEAPLDFESQIKWTWKIIQSGGGTEYEYTRSAVIPSGRKTKVEDSIRLDGLQAGGQLLLIIHPMVQTIPAKIAWVSISEYSIIAVDTSDEPYPGNEVMKFTVDERENRVLKVTKPFGLEGTLASMTNARSIYAYENNLMVLQGGLYIRAYQFEYMLTSSPFTLVNWIKNTYLKHYGWNKLRVSADIKNMTKGKILWGFTEVLDPNIDQTFTVASSRWNPKLDYYSVELIGFTTRDWILATGFWNDGGVWIDTEFWIDEL